MSSPFVHQILERKYRSLMTFLYLHLPSTLNTLLHPYHHVEALLAEYQKISLLSYSYRTNNIT